MAVLGLQSFLRAGLALLVSAAFTATPAAAVDAAYLDLLQRGDMRLARIGYRLATENAELCSPPSAAMGFQLHTLDQYAPAMRASVAAHFGFETGIAVEGVIPGSPAAAAGIRTGDSLLAIGQHSLSAAAPSEGASMRRLTATVQQVAELPPGQPVPVTLLRDGKKQVLTALPAPACPTRFEMKVDDDPDALADGKMVQITSALLAEYDDALLASVVAHEFAHNILRHRERLEDQNVSFGLFSGFGRSVRFIRETELAADILSVHLLAEARYRPENAIRFWQDFGPRRSGIFRSRSHPDWRDRVATMRAEIARMRAGNPLAPSLVSRRNEPLDGDWQALIVKAE